jgi:protein-tyrosine-phosphatase/DNA-binding transcriptional ArsR family regulator
MSNQPSVLSAAGADAAAALLPALRALADPVRLRLVALMAANPTATVGELGGAFDVSQPTISHHLRMLFEAGVVVRSRVGTSVSYRVNPAALEGIAAVLTGLVSTNGLAAGQPGGPPAGSTRRSRPDLGPDAADHVLRSGAERLAYRFAGVFAMQTIDRMVHESYQTLYRTATIKTHVPVLALRFAEERLTALAQVEGRLAKPLTEVLLVCTHNAGRSQIAAGYLRALGEGRVHVRSAGSLPGARVSSTVVDVMAERGIDVGEEFPKPLTDDVIRAADVVVTMGCGDACPLYPGKRYLDWDLRDPEGQDVATVRAIADSIESKVQQLLIDIGAVGKRESDG